MCLIATLKYYQTEKLSTSLTITTHCQIPSMNRNIAFTPFFLKPTKRLNHNRDDKYNMSHCFYTCLGLYINAIGSSRRLQIVLVHGLGCSGLIRAYGCKPRITNFNRLQC
jgi:hypothetical protein